MSRFIELHQPDHSAPRPIIINPDWIAYIQPSKDGSILYFGSVNFDGHQGGFSSRLYSLRVKEDYYTVKELIQCQ